MINFLIIMACVIIFAVLYGIAEENDDDRK
jgi:hypothetical protein